MWMDLKDVLREVSQTQKGQAPCDSTYVRFQRGQVLRDRGRWWEPGRGELVFNGVRVSVWEDEKVLETGGGGGCATT